jgi:oligosaccharyltransferase complex subunit alpha (ribophorin I)
VAHTDKSVALHLVPRYVLFGGWRAAFCLGYNVPSQYLLSRDAADPDLYMLNVTFYARYKEAVPTEEYELVVTLPEGASDIQVHAPFALDSDAPSLKFTYLDTVGRPVVRVRKHNVVYDHDQYVQVTYRFSQQYMLHEPLLLCVVFFCLLLAVIVYSRINLSLAAISGARENAARAATRGAECVARLRDVLERRDRLHNALDAASTKLAKTRNKALWEAERQAVQDGWDECKREALRLAGELEVLDAQKGAVARQVDAAERLRQKAHMNVALHEAAARQSGTPDPTHEVKRLELERALQEADDQVERLAASLVDE